jgi:adenylate cyclase
MSTVDLQAIESLITARTTLLSALSGLRINASQLQKGCQSDDPDLIEPLEAVLNGLKEMVRLCETKLPITVRQGQELSKHLDEGGWHKYERTFVHDLRNPLGVVLGYNEILDETLEDFALEVEYANSRWIEPLRTLIESFSNQLHHLNQSLDRLFSARPTRDVSSKVTTLIPMSDSSPLDRTPFADMAMKKLGISSQLTPNAISVLRDQEEVISRVAQILIVDDNQSNRDLLSSMLSREGYQTITASSAEEALSRLEEGEGKFDLILLDLVMPDVTGYELLEQLKFSSKWRKIPVLMISGDNEIESTIRCIERGAEDFLQKPFNRVLLKARIGACIQKKFLMDETEEQNKRFKDLLNRILPISVVKRLDEGEDQIADRFHSTTIIFSDLVGFTKMSAELTPSQLISVLDEVFSAFDELADRFGVEKIKTIGDAYMAASGLPISRDDHADAAVEMGLEMIKALERVRLKLQLPLKMRVGIHSGPVAAGIIGQNRFLYDVWGDTVNLASRLEASGQPSAVHLSDDTAKLLKKTFPLQSTGGVDIKGKGMIESHLLFAFPV